MTFFNKLFPTRKKIAKRPEKLFCEKLFTFDAEQVQVVVFKECDFRGRKLLFDSRSVQKIGIDFAQMDEKSKKSFIEITNGFGYLITKPDCNVGQLKELIFGSVAMAYRDTIYKIHQLTLPPRLIFSQVFPSANFRFPRVCTSFDEEFVRFDDSGTGSFYSGHSGVSATSTHSDTVLFCKKRRQENLSVDQAVSVVTNSSLVASSGFGELSNGSVDPAACTDDDSKVILRSNIESPKSYSSSVTATENVSNQKSINRKYKLGLAVILHMTSDENKQLENFLMHHMFLVEAVLWKLRRGVETGCLRHRTFVSTVYEITKHTAQWFVDLLTGPHMKTHLWSHLTDCDISPKASSSINYSNINNNNNNKTSKHSNNEFAFTKFRKLFGAECLADSDSETKMAEDYLNELCTLLMQYDVKDTNFFLSTLMTAILTYHLGWVSNHLSEEESLNLPKEPLRKQLSELYGCTGHPKRVSQTLLIGSQNGLIDRVINVLGYFIRCSPVEWRKYEKCPLDFVKINNEMCDAENDCLRNEKKSEDLEDETTVKKSDVLTVKQPMKKNKSLLGNLNDLNTMENIEIADESDKGDVIFVLGENERLQGLKLNQNVNVIKKEEPKKHRYSGVKFNFQQYPQIFENYMKSKNIELPSISTNKKFDGFGFSSSNTRTVDFSQYDNTSNDDEEDEPLQTPSNASEMESTNEFSIEKPEHAKAIETIQKRRKSVEFVRQHQKNTVLVAEPQLLLKFIHLPLPRYETQKVEEKYAMYANTLFRGFHNNYISNMLIQGVNSFANWQMCLKRDLVQCAKHPSIDETIEESLAIIANTDIWEVQVMSSHTFVINKSASGVAIGMSQLVGNMLETLVHLWRLKVPPKYCLMHIEQKLREFYERSKAVAQLLLDTDFCSMELLTSSLKLDVNDVPLLLAVASVHTPEVMQRYGLSFQ